MNKDTKKFYDKVRAAIGEATSMPIPSVPAQW